MTSQVISSPVAAMSTPQVFSYDRWMESQGVPVYKGFFIEDCRTIEVGWWPLQERHVAFIQLEGMQGVNETRVTEVPPGATTPPFKLGFDEVVYVLQGTGLTSIWRTQDGKDKRTFEWSPHGMFVLARNYWHQFSNTRGDTPVRLLHYNFLPVAMSINPSPNYHFNNPYEEPEPATADLYGEAKAVRVVEGETDRDPFLWFGNFFPNLNLWDKLSPYQWRGAGGHHLAFQFPNCEMHGHMSVFEPRLYKKAHRHGPGVAITIPAGEGYSIMWPEGQEKVVVPWHEGSLFTPPGRWFHQHFNVGTTGARYLALSPLRQIGGRTERVINPLIDQIEYAREEPWVRQKFEEELAKKGTTSVMPEECYKDPNYQWSFKKTYAEVTATSTLS